jgi:hypothetical protein
MKSSAQIDIEVKILDRNSIVRDIFLIDPFWFLLNDVQGVILSSSNDSLLDSTSLPESNIAPLDSRWVTLNSAIAIHIKRPAY